MSGMSQRAWWSTFYQLTGAVFVGATVARTVTATTVVQAVQALVYAVLAVGFVLLTIERDHRPES